MSSSVLDQGFLTKLVQFCSRISVGEGAQTKYFDKVEEVVRNLSFDSSFKGDLRSELKSSLQFAVSESDISVLSRIEKYMKKVGEILASPETNKQYFPQFSSNKTDDTVPQPLEELRRRELLQQGQLIFIDNRPCSVAMGDFSKITLYEHIETDDPYAVVDVVLEKEDALLKDPRFISFVYLCSAPVGANEQPLSKMLRQININKLQEWDVNLVDWVATRIKLKDTEASDETKDEKARSAKAFLKYIVDNYLDLAEYIVGKKDDYKSLFPNFNTDHIKCMNDRLKNQFVDKIEERVRGRRLFLGQLFCDRGQWKILDKALIKDLRTGSASMDAQLAHALASSAAAASDVSSAVEEFVLEDYLAASGSAAASASASAGRDSPATPSTVGASSDVSEDLEYDMESWFKDNDERSSPDSPASSSAAAAASSASVAAGSSAEPVAAAGRGSPATASTEDDLPPPAMPEWMPDANRSLTPEAPATSAAVAAASGARVRAATAVSQERRSPTFGMFQGLGQAFTRGAKFKLIN